MSVEIRTMDTSWRGTISAIFVDGIFICNSLELPWNDNQEDISCIPAGDYDLVLEFSPSFGKELYEIYGVEGRSETKFHSGNFLSQILGCILTGDIKIGLSGQYEIKGGTSRKALDMFMDALDGIKKTRLFVTGRPSI